MIVPRVWILLFISFTDLVAIWLESLVTSGFLLSESCHFIILGKTTSCNIVLCATNLFVRVIKNFKVWLSIASIGS